MRISASRLEAAGEQAAAERVAARLSEIRGQLEDLSDEDGAAITAFAALRDAGQELPGQERLCRMPVEMGSLLSGGGHPAPGFPPVVRGVQDDLEMAITLLGGAVRAAALLLDSNLRLWPEPALLALFEPELADLRRGAGRVQPFESVRK